MTKEISALLCAKEYEVADAVGKLKDEQTRMKSQIAELQQKPWNFVWQRFQRREDCDCIRQRIVLIFQEK